MAVCNIIYSNTPKKFTDIIAWPLGKLFPFAGSSNGSAGRFL